MPACFWYKWSCSSDSVISTVPRTYLFLFLSSLLGALFSQFQDPQVERRMAKMAALFLAGMLLFVVLSATSVSVVEGASRVSACDEVCGRISRERDECCRQHGNEGASHCEDSQMFCRWDLMGPSLFSDVSSSQPVSISSKTYSASNFVLCQIENCFARTYSTSLTTSI